MTALRVIAAVMAALGVSIAREKRNDEPAREGRGLEVRLAGATALMDDERAREQSLNTRGVAIAAAALASLAIVGVPLKAAVDLNASELGHIELTICAALTVASAMLAIVIAISRVLMPSSRSGMDDSMLRTWLEDEGLKDSEDEARWELLDGVVKTIASRREVCKQKAGALTWAYRAFLAEIAFALPCVVTLTLT